MSSAVHILSVSAATMAGVVLTPLTRQRWLRLDYHAG